MARPLKEGMDYFPHDTDASTDEKIQGMEAQYGLSGHAFYFKLLERIYRHQSFELDLSNEDSIKILARNWHISVDRFNAMLETAIKWRLFDFSEWRDRKTLRSNGISKRASVVLQRRDSMKTRYLALKTPISASETSKKFVRNSSESTQSKVKESKVNTKTETEERVGGMGEEKTAATTALPSTDLNLKAIATCYEENIGQITPMIRDELLDLASRFSGDWFKRAVGEACRANQRRLNYVAAILDRWQVDGLPQPGEKTIKRGGNGNGRPSTYRQGDSGGNATAHYTTNEERRRSAT